MVFYCLTYCSLALLYNCARNDKKISHFCLIARSPQQNNMFEEMDKYLPMRIDCCRNTDLPDLNQHQPVSAESSRPSTAAVLNPVKTGVRKTQIIELTALFTEVSALTRQRSPRAGFSIYPNLCYTVNRHSKPVVLDLLP